MNLLIVYITTIVIFYCVAIYNFCLLQFNVHVESDKREITFKTET